MATYYAGGATAFAAKQAKGSISGGGERRVSALFTIGTDNTATLANSDVLQMVKIPAGAKILDISLSCTDMDTGANSVTLDIGDGDDVDRFFDGSTLAQAGAHFGASSAQARIGANITAANFFANPCRKTFTVEDTIDITILTMGTAATTGYIELDVTYTFDTV
jgi:hypothetical protein